MKGDGGEAVWFPSARSAFAGGTVAQAGMWCKQVCGQWGGQDKSENYGAVRIITPGIAFDSGRAENSDKLYIDQKARAMKFCYIDESGFGTEPYAVMVGIIVDASRMHLAKSEWNGLLIRLSRLTHRPIKEIHTCEFYPGNGVWRGLSGDLRSRVATEIFRWLNDRKHLVIYSAIDKGAYNQQISDGSMPEEIGSLWKCLALHIALGIQKIQQPVKNNKGNTVLVFDNSERESRPFCDLIDSPPEWTDAYYGKEPTQDRLDQIIDVPFFVDSKHASLIQMADFSAYFLRRYAEITTGAVPPRYPDEQNKVNSWVRLLCQRCVPQTATFPRRSRNYAQDIFWSMAPECLREM